MASGTSRRPTLASQGCPKMRKSKKWKFFEKIVKENFPNLVKETDMQVQEVQRAPNKMDAKRPTPRHIKIKMPKVYRDNLKNSKRNKVS